jgi:hypothetical protein
LIPASLERRLLQATILVACLVPLYGGSWGVLGHLHTIGVSSQSEARYLSGLLLGIGLAFIACTPTIERRGREVRLMAAVIVVGGLSRLAGIGVTGAPPEVAIPLVMELGVTVALALWRERVERRVLAKQPAAR